MVEHRQGALSSARRELAHHCSLRAQRGMVRHSTPLPCLMGSAQPQESARGEMFSLAPNVRSMTR
jgi:hypothetical protein